MKAANRIIHGTAITWFLTWCCFNFSVTLTTTPIPVEATNPSEISPNFLGCLLGILGCFS
jgi:hypothetical protein